MSASLAVPETLRLIAFAIGAVSLVLSTVSLVLLALTPELDLLAGWGFAGYDAIFAAVYVAVGLLITSRRSHNVIGWLFLSSGILSGVQAGTSAYGAYALALSKAGGDIALWVSNWVWLPPAALIVLILLLYPNGRLPSPGWRWAAVGLLPVTAATTLLWMVAPPEAASIPGVAVLDPLGLAPSHPLRAIAGASLVLMTIWFLIAAASLAARMRGRSAIERQQVKWIAFAAVIVGLTLGASVVVSLTAPGEAIAKAAQIVSVASILLIPIAATLAILRYRLYDIDLLINRTLVYGAVSAVLLVAYAGAVVVLQMMLRPVTGGSEFAVAISTLLVAALFQPLRRRVQRAVDRRFYRSRYDAAGTLERFSARLRDQVDLDALSSEIVGVVHETIRPAHAALWLRR